MQLIILDKNMDTLGVVSVFNTLIWDRRYYDSGLFELYTPAEFFELMNTGRYLYRSDRTDLGVIREVNFARDAKGARTAYCKGYFSEELLNDRVLNTQINITGTPEAIGRQLVQKFAINPTDAGRKIAHLQLGALSGVGSSITVMATGDRLGDKLYEIEKTQELSHRLAYDYQANTLSFVVWQGKDRTDAQEVNSWAIFSDSFYNVKNAVYDRDESECKNFAYVAGEGEGATRVITYTQAQYRQLLRQRGLEKLAEYEKVETVNSDVDPDANLVYMTDFDLGDLCTYRYTDVGIETTKRITEIQEVYEGSKQTLSVVFGNDMATSITKIIKREAS